MSIQLTASGYGTKHWNIVHDNKSQLQEFIERAREIRGVNLWNTDTDNPRVSCGNKSEEAAILALVKSVNTPPPTPVRNGTRKIILAASARPGMKTGKSWVADLLDVEKHSLHPSWEGEWVCYLYE